MIEVRGLSKQYGAVRAVDELFFDVEPGKVTGFLGPNGAGKSTTMRMVMGLDRPTAGTARVNGRDYAGLGAPLHEVGALLDAGAVHAREASSRPCSGRRRDIAVLLPGSSALRLVVGEGLPGLTVPDASVTLATWASAAC